MILQLPPYPKHRESGVAWLGKIPTDWGIERGKWLFNKISRPVLPASEIVTCFRNGTVTLRKNRREGGFSESLKEIGYQGVKKGDLVIHGMDAFAGAVGVSDSNGKCSPVYAVCRPVTNVNTDYYAYVVREMARSQWVIALTRGIRERSTDFRFETFSNQLLPVPEANTQKQIVAFLKHMSFNIEHIVRSKRRLIELLNEQKQAIIHQAVTRGLDPNVRMKPSGIDWLGDVPEHWQVSRLKFETAFIVDCLHATPEYRDDGMFPAIRTADVTVGKLHLQKAKRVSQQQYDIWTSRLVPKGGDTLYTREGERYGIAATVPEGIQLCISQRMMIFRARDSINSKFLMWQLNCGHIYAQASEQIIGAAAPHINIERIKNYKIILPPKNEQEQIDSWITQACDEIHNGIEKIVREIDLLREYRTRLIADVVTGKLDVRGVRLDEAVIEKDLLEDFEENEAEMDSDKEVDMMEGLDE